MITPVKAIKGQCQQIKNWDKAADDLFSKAVSRVRQPIESLFNWLIVKTDIQKQVKLGLARGYWFIYLEKLLPLLLD